MKPTVVKTRAQHREYLARLAALAALDPSPESREGEELELLSVLVEAYEQEAFPISRPDPVDAVLFRMHEQDLRQADLVPYFGSRSRVSEFLSRQRPLTVAQIRELSEGLGIPAEVLIQDSVAPKMQLSINAGEALDWEKFPVREICSRHWISGLKPRQDESARLSLVKEFIERALGPMPTTILARRTIRGDAFSWQLFYALTAWQARVLDRARDPEHCALAKFDIAGFDEAFLRDLARLSARQDGPRQALLRLRQAGVAVVVEKHLTKTKLDGAAMLNAAGEPVIGLTLRFDRLDNFWFTLLHECAHIAKHLSKPGDVFLDRLADKESEEDVELEANRVARDTLISRAHWRSASVRQMPTKPGIIAFAAELGIHPAIVAGRIQQESGNFAVFSDMVGRGEVRALLGEQ